ncbi:hypothetical protein AB0P21_40770 [Kribbella sp. NPDC056861]|uniref:hypothetical protein n=1 Tax=Kribbella sp. NPDC056861 TaxID=3154857 RepID=UPI00342FCC94
MSERLSIDYNVLNDAKKQLHELAGDIKPLLHQSIFHTLSKPGLGLLGSRDVENAVHKLHSNGKWTLEKAHDGLMELGNSFGSVGEAFLALDANIAQGLGITGANLGLDNWLQEKTDWEQHKDQECSVHNSKAGGNGDGECVWSDPGPPPVDQVVSTDRGQIHTHLTLDDQYHVVKEEIEVEYDGHKYTTVNSYADEGRTTITDNGYPDGSTSHDETRLGTDGSGTKTTKNSDGDWNNYTRGPTGPNGPAEWVWTEGTDDPAKKTTTGPEADTYEPTGWGGF